MNIESLVTYKRLKKWFLRKTPTSGVRRVGPVFSAVASDIGIGREENQDRAALVRSVDCEGKPYTLVLISDGMGGMKDGGVCAAIAMAAFLSSFFIRSKTRSKHSEWLSGAALDANRVIFDQYLGRGGATLSVLLFRSDGSGGILNIGDTRVYGCDGSSLMQLTVDDTLAGQLGDKLGALKGRNELLQFVGMGVDLDPHYLSFMPSGLKSFVLTTDGVHYLNNELMRDLIVNAEDVGVAARRLVEVAKWCGGRDNCSSVIVSVEPSIGSILTDDLDSDLYEIWDSFGDLQISCEIAAQDKPEKFFADVKKILGLNSDAELVQKKTVKEKKNLTTKSRRNYGGGKKLGGRRDVEVEKKSSDGDSDELKENSMPQLKMSFPSKE
ncbi:PP2C family serine/threonine-protein phosphatase [Pseudomonas sp. GZJR-8]|uniref:PP2C family protein-serine/threonine phosphatase n=1 Tax=Pseudomonas sp. GZJR-8 TaxID=1395925 RepID=UPI0011B0B84E|nr:hypothetical protein [Pseudomonas sp. GZJR-8]